MDVCRFVASPFTAFYPAKPVPSPFILVTNRMPHPHNIIDSNYEQLLIFSGVGGMRRRLEIIAIVAGGEPWAGAANAITYYAHKKTKRKSL